MLQYVTAKAITGLDRESAHLLQLYVAIKREAVVQLQN